MTGAAVNTMLKRDWCQSSKKRCPECAAANALNQNWVRV